MSTIRKLIDRAQLQAQLVSKQRLYAQMLKDGITKHATLDELHLQINDLTIRIHGRK